MRFDSETGKKYGKKSSRKGVKDKFSRESMERINKVLNQLEKTIEEDIQKMKPEIRVRLWQELQEYKNPKLQRTELTGSVNTGPKEIGFED